MPQFFKLWIAFYRSWQKVQYRQWYYRLPISPLDLEWRKYLIITRLSRMHLRTVSESPAIPIRRVKLDKWRNLPAFQLEDRLLQNVIQNEIHEDFEKRLSKYVHSYRANHSNYSAVRSVQLALKKYLSSTPIQNRALYTIKADISNCTDSIPVHPQSRLWQEINNTLQTSRSIWSTSLLLKKIEESLRPTFIVPGVTGPYQNLYGIPTGSALLPTMINLYLEPLDKLFEEVLSRTKAGIYCRYGDDFLFAHPDPIETEQTYENMLLLLRELELTIHPLKLKRFRWSGSGFQGQSVVDFLGLRIHFKGFIQLPPKKVRKFLRDMKRCIRHTQQLSQNEPPEVQRELIGNVVRSRTSSNGDQIHPYLLLYYRCADDRSQAKDLDHEVQLLIAKTLSKKKSIKAFRKVSKREIRNQIWQTSISRTKNKVLWKT